MAENEGEDEVRRAGREHGQATLEYVLIGIVVALVLIFLLVRFSGALGGRYTDADGRIEQAKAGAQASGETASLEGGGGGSSASGSKPSAASGASGDAEIEEESRSDDAPSDGRVRVARLSFDMTTILWLGLLVVVAAVLIAMRAFAVAKAKPKPRI